MGTLSCGCLVVAAAQSMAALRLGLAETLCSWLRACSSSMLTTWTNCSPHLCAEASWAPVAQPGQAKRTGLPRPQGACVGSALQMGLHPARCARRPAGQVHLAPCERVKERSCGSSWTASVHRGDRQQAAHCGSCCVLCCTALIGLRLCTSSALCHRAQLHLKPALAARLPHPVKL